MKKIVALMLAAGMLFASLAGCAKTDNAEPEADKTEDAAVETTDEAAPTDEVVDSPDDGVEDVQTENPDGDDTADSGKKLYIAVVSKGFQHQFWQAVKEGADKAAAELDVEITFEGPEKETQIDKQIEMIDAALAKNPDGICLAALDSQAVVGQLKKCQDANIPVVGFDSGVESDIPIATAATDNKAAAAAAADKMAEAIGSEGKIGVIVHDQTSVTGVERRDGFVNRIAEQYPNIEVVDVQYGEGDHLKSADIAKAMLQAHTDLKGIFGANEGSAVGALKGVQEAGAAGNLVVIGFDAGQAQKDGVRSGEMFGAITQDPVAIGYEAVKACVMAIRGETVEKNIDTGFQWYDASNVDSPELASILYD